MILEPYPGSVSAGHPRLLLVPSAGADLGLPAEYVNTVDARGSIVVVSLDQLRESTDQVVGAFRTYAGPRFVNGLSTAGTGQAAS